MTDSETTAPAPGQLWRADLPTRSSIEFHFPEGDGLKQVTWHFYINGDFQRTEIITPEEARDRLRAMAAGDANPPAVRAKATEYADEFDRRLALTATVLDEFTLRSNPEHKVTITSKGAEVYWWQCGSDCHDGDSAPTPSLARLAAYHHAMTCGLEWTQVDQEYRDLLAKASGGRWLVRLPVYLGGGDAVEFEQSGLKGAIWRCTGCGAAGTSHHLFAIAAAAVHAVECQLGDRRIPPEHYLDEVERAAAPRIELRQAEAVAPVQARLDQREAALAELQTEHEALAGDRDAQAATATRLDGELADERARTRGWRIATMAAAVVAVGALALFAGVTL